MATGIASTSRMMISSGPAITDATVVVRSASSGGDRDYAPSLRRLIANRSSDLAAVIQHPCRRPGTPRDAPQHREPVVGRTRGIGSDGVGDRLLACAAHGELDHPVGEAGTVDRVESVPVEKIRALRDPGLVVGEVIERGDIVVVDLRIEGPGCSTGRDRRARLRVVFREVRGRTTVANGPRGAPRTWTRGRAARGASPRYPLARHRSTRADADWLPRCHRSAAAPIRGRVRGDGRAAGSRWHSGVRCCDLTRRP